MMADKTDPKTDTAKRIQRTEAYAEKVRKMFAKTVNEILALNKSMPKLDEGVMYSFDGTSVKMQQKVDTLLRQLYSAVTLAIQQGITLEWEQANIECDKLVKSVFGKNALSNPKLNAITDRNKAAMNAFIERSENGLNLSDRIWNTVRQLRDEMEVAMTVAIGEGQSASQMSRKVREYLNDPDLMFRRFRYKDENGEWQRKWKKRIKDEKTGKYKWVDYDRDDYKTGAGVYKSSAKNAMRVTRTETNIAYRRADNERWQQMDFVLGQRIQLSRNHPRKDICDTLQGEYPKGFVFDGWHPQCFCFAVPVLVDEDEMAKMNEAFLKGESYTPKGKQITEYPQAFRDWVKDNAENIKISREKGTEPYFIRNNAEIIDNILNPKPKELTTLEKAKIRHDARTPEQIEAIKNRWAERQHKHELIKKTAGNVLKVASDYGEVDYSKLQQYIKEGNLTEMQTETKIVAQKISSIKKQEAALSTLIPDAHGWHKQFSMAELQAVYDAVKAKLESWSSLTLEKQAKKLNFEAYNFLGGNMKGVQQKYATWKVSQAAYIKELNAVKYKIDYQEQTEILAIVKNWSDAHPKSQKVASLLAEAEAEYASPSDMLTLKSKVAAAKAEMDKRIAEQARRDAKRSNLQNMSKAEIDRLLDRFEKETINDADSRLRSHIEKVWKSLTQEEKIIVTKYTQTYSYLNEPLRGIPYYGSLIPNADHVHDLPILTRVLDKFSMPQNTVIRRGVNNYVIKELGYDLSQLKAGDIFTDKGFLSSAVHRDKGFFQDYNLIICVPKGAKGIYAEPFSHYTDHYRFDYKGKKSLWDGNSCEILGDEMEWIGQRGSKFRVIKKQGKNIYLEMIGQLQ